MKRQSVIKIIEACVLLVIGILFCVSLAMGTNVLSIILGSALIAAGSVIIILSIVTERSVATPIALGGLFALAIGIFFIVANAVAFIFAVIPYILIVFGSGIVIDAFLGYFAREERILGIFIVKLIVGAALITVGALLLAIPEFADYVALIVGIALILLAIDSIVLEFIKAKE